jgi:hypothetical protein
MQRLTDLLESFRVYALCVPCGRMEAVSLTAALERLGPTSTVADLRARVRCRGCGRRTCDVRVVYVGPEGREVSFQYRR